MRLALACGRLDVDRFLNEVSSAQLAEWEAFDRIEPGGNAHDDERWGMVLSMMLNYLAKSGKTYGPADFFPHLAVPDERTAEQVVADEAEKARQWAEQW